MEIYNASQAIPTNSTSTAPTNRPAKNLTSSPTSNPGIQVLYDPFEDMDLLANPPWSGDTDMFTHQPETNNTILQLQAPEGASRAVLSTPSPTVYGTWSWVYEPGFEASNVNRAFLVLLSDRPNFNYLDGSEWSGYAIRTGENGDEKRFRLVRFDDGDQTVLLTGDLPVEQDHRYRITATRSPDGDWQLNEEDLTAQRSAQSGIWRDQTYTQSGYAGLFLRFTSGNRSAFRFDTFEIRNLQPFVALAAWPKGSYQLEMEFTYPPDMTLTMPSMFLLDEQVEPVAVEVADASTRLLLTFSEPISDGMHELFVEGLISVFGDSLENDVVSFAFVNPFRIVRADFLQDFVEVRFSVPPAGPDAMPESRVEINGSDDLLITTSEGDSLLWQFTPSFTLPTGESQIQFTDWRDQDGYVLKNPVVSGWVLDEASERDVVINELFYRVPAEWRTDLYPRPAYIELVNRSGKLLNLKNWTLNGRVFQSETDLILQPEDYAVITKGLSVFYPIYGVQPYWEAEQFPSLPLTTPGEVVLRNHTGQRIDSLRYEPSTWGGDGVALEKTDPNTASADRSKWKKTEATLLGTPGIENSVYKEDQTPPVPQIAAVIESPRLANQSPQFANQSHLLAIEPPLVEIRFDEFVVVSDETSLELDGVVIPRDQWLLASGRRIRIQSSLLQPATDHLLRIRRLQDVAGNLLVESVIPVAHPAGEGDLVFHELMADPLTDAFDGRPDQTEFLEIRNIREYALQMNGLEIRDLPDENGEERTLEPSDDEDRWVPANGYFVIYPDPDGQPFDESLFARAYQQDPGMVAHSAPVYRSTLSLAAAGKTIRLFGPGDVAMDSLTYWESWHNPNVRDTRGRSLERIDPFAVSNADWNWGTSGGVTGGTPGRENSLLTDSTDHSGSHGVELAPQVFSPDGDGRDDLLAISYYLPESDYLLRVRVYDEGGRLIRTVTEDLAAGNRGIVYWNGFDEYGLRGRAGLYVIHTEAYDRAGGRTRSYKNAAAIAVTQ